jgi:hypothetical protein
MGVCCTGGKMSGEDYIVYITLSTNLPNLTYSQLEKELLKQCIIVRTGNGKKSDSDLLKIQTQEQNENTIINREKFYKHFTDILMPNYNGKRDKHIKQMSKMFDNIIVFDENDSLNIYQILLSLFSVLKHEKPCEEFFKTVYKIFQSSENSIDLSELKNGEEKKRNSSTSINHFIDNLSVTYEQMKNMLKTYFEINFYVITNSIANIPMPEEEYEKSDMEYLIGKIYNEINVQLYYKHFVRYFKQLIPKITNSSLLKYRDFTAIFMDKEFIFDFKLLRQDFLSFCLNAEETTYN